MINLRKLRGTAFLLLFIFSFSALSSVQRGVLAAPTVQASTWAAGEIGQAAEYRLIPDILSGDIDYRSNITRQEFSHLALRLYASLSGKSYAASSQVYYTDTTDPYVMTAYELGLLAGRGDGTFAPNDPMTRQEMAVAFTNILAASGIDTSVTAGDILEQLDPFQDISDVSGWATESLTFVLKTGLMRGMDETELWPKANTTREMAIATSLRCSKAYALPPVQTPAPTPQPTPAAPSFTTRVSGDLELVSAGDRSATLRWQAVSGASTYQIDTYLDQSNFWFSDEDKFVKSQSSAGGTMAEIDNLRTDMTYKIWVNALDDSGTAIASYSATLYIEPLETQEQKEAKIFAQGDITTKQQADALMETITVDVWRIGSDGSKYASTASLTVHKAIADITRAVFTEIFNGEEQFPIKDVGAYNWRDPMSSGRLSHHNYGTAIDINYNENYCVYSDGSTIGEFYAPGEDPYSIPADSEVVSIFAKYGFAWGGDEWSNPNDYMHFSYLGL